MPDVLVYCKNAENVAIEGATVKARAIGAGNEPCYVNGGSALVQEVVEHSAASTGLVTLTLTANALLLPSNSFYRLEIRGPNEKKAKVAYIQVPNGAGPYTVEDVLHEPGTVDESALAAHIATIKTHGDWSDSAPSAGQVPIWDGTNWTPGDTVATDIEAAALVTAHSALATGVHGVGASTVESVAGSTAKAAAAQSASATDATTKANVAQAAAEATAAAALASEATTRGTADTTLQTNITAEASARAAADAAHAALTNNPHSVTKSQVGLGNADNTTDIGKPVSTAQQAAIDAAIATLLDSAPGALNTLNELAAALGDDPNFATTITNLLALKAAIADSVMDGDAAGGVLSGNYPNPGFAADMATQAELDAHLNDSSDAHDASAISILDTANDFTATDVEGALAELQSDAETDDAARAAHEARTDNPHAVTKTQVGLANATNTSDADKPVSTAQQTALDAKVAKSLYDANSILAATSDDTPAVVTVAEDRLLGRIAGGSIDDLTPAQVKTLIALVAGDLPSHGAAQHDDVTRSWFVWTRGAMTADGSTNDGLGTAPAAVTSFALADSVSRGGYSQTVIPANAKPNSPLSMTVYWVPASTVGGSTAARWSFQTLILANGADVTAAGTTVAFTGVNDVKTANLLVIEALTEVLASVSAQDLLRYNVRRIGSDAADTYTGIGHLLGVRFDYTATG